MATLTTEYEALDGLVTLTLEIDYDAEPYVPAKINADPDDCYPESGGITVNEVRVVGITAWNDDSTHSVGWKDIQPGSIPGWLSEGIVTWLHEPDTFWQDIVAAELDEREQVAKADDQAAREAAWEERRANKPR